MSKRQSTTQNTLTDTSDVSFTPELNYRSHPHQQFLEQIPASTQPGSDRWVQLWQAFVERHDLAEELHISENERRRMQEAPR